MKNTIRTWDQVTLIEAFFHFIAGRVKGMGSRRPEVWNCFKHIQYNKVLSKYATAMIDSQNREWKKIKKIKKTRLALQTLQPALFWFQIF
jgi:hypothetical protein